MNSTDAILNAAPPVRGLLERHIETAVRAYGRRVRMLDGMQSLLALRAVDQVFDALVDSARYYGDYALQAADRIAQSVTAPDRDGAVFIGCVLMLGLVDDASERRDQLVRHFHASPAATWCACQSYGDAALCELLLRDALPAMNDLGVILSGVLTQVQQAGKVARYAQAADTAMADVALLSLVRMGCAPEDFAPRARQALRGGAPSMSMLQAIGESGVAGLEADIEQLAVKRLQGPSARLDGANAPQLDYIVALWAARRPLQALATVMAAPANDDTRLRVIALAGHIDGLLPLLRGLTQQSAPYSPAQLDVLRMVFGALPAALTLQPGDPAVRGSALRELACSVFRDCGCNDLQPSGLEGWGADLLNGPLWPLHQIRLRARRPLRTTNALRPAQGVSHAMRAWLYLERAATTTRPFPLSAHDHAPRQLAALQMIQDFDELLGHQ